MPITANYRTASEDTTVEAEQVMLALAGRRSSAQKFARIWEMTEYVHDLAFAALRRRHLELSDDEIRFRLTAQRLGPELTLAAYGRLPETNVR